MTNVSQPALDQTAATIPHQGLAAPATAPADPTWISVTPGALGTRQEWVPPSVARYVGQQQALAAADVGRADLKGVAATLDAATQKTRVAISALEADYDEAVEYAPASAEAVAALLAPKANRAHAELREAVAARMSDWDDALAADEQAAAEKIAGLAHLPPEAEDRALGFVAAVERLNPRYATAAVVALAEKIAAGKAHPMDARAALPALASMIETRQGFDTAEMRSAVTALEVAGRDRAWYAAHGAFAAAQATRVRLASFDEQ